MSLPLCIVTYNLRFDSQPDNITVAESLASLPDPLQKPRFLHVSGKEQPWSTRRLRVAQHLLSSPNLVIAGFQEALVRQVKDLSELLGPEWNWIGVGRDDGVAAGEFSPLFFKTSVVKVLSNDAFWLSNTPFQPSKYPGAGSIRICTVANLVLNHKENAVTITVLNTHLDEQSETQRTLAASMLLVRAKFEAYHSNAPVIIMGDFNSPSSGRDSGAYKILTGTQPPVTNINAEFMAKFSVPNGAFPVFKFLDLRGEAAPRNVSANYATFTGFTAPNNASQWSRIDFMFGANNVQWNVNEYAVESALDDYGVLESDHRPVFVKLSL